jgi:hypothetical protein
MGAKTGLSERLKVCENIVPNKIFRTKEDEASRQFSYDLRDLCELTNIVIKTKSRTLRDCEIRWGDKECIQKFG